MKNHVYYLKTMIKVGALALLCFAMNQRAHAVQVDPETSTPSTSHVSLASEATSGSQALDAANVKLDSLLSKSPMAKKIADEAKQEGLRILGKVTATSGNLSENIKNIKTESDAVQFVLKIIDQLSAVDEAVFAPLYELVTPLPLIPLGPLPEATELDVISPGSVVGTGISIITDIGDVLNDVQIEAHIANMLQRIKQAYSKFNELTNNKYVTDEDRKNAAHCKSVQTSLMGKLAHKIEKVTTPLAKTVNKMMKPLENAFSHLENVSDSFIRPIAELNKRIPFLPILGPIETFDYLVHIRSLQQLMHIIEETLDNKLKPVKDKSYDLITFAELKEKDEESSVLARFLEPVIKDKEEIENKLAELMQPLCHFPFLASFLVKSGVKILDWVADGTGGILQTGGEIVTAAGAIEEPFADIATVAALGLDATVVAEPVSAPLTAVAVAADAAGGAAIGGGLLGIAGGEALKIAEDEIDCIITSLIYLTYIRNLEQVMSRLLDEIKKEQTKKGDILHEETIAALPEVTTSRELTGVSTTEETITTPEAIIPTPTNIHLETVAHQKTNAQKKLINRKKLARIKERRMQIKKRRALLLQRKKQEKKRQSTKKRNTQHKKQTHLKKRKPANRKPKQTLIKKRHTQLRRKKAHRKKQAAV